MLEFEGASAPKSAAGCCVGGVEPLARSISVSVEGRGKVPQLDVTPEELV